MQAGAGRGRGRARVVRRAVAVTVLVHAELLRVTRVVGVRVLPAATAVLLVVRVAEVLGLAVPALSAALSTRSGVAVTALRGAGLSGARRGPLLLRRVRLPAVRGRRLPASVLRRGRRLPSVRLLLRVLLTCAVVPAASDPESSHVTERTRFGRAGGWRSRNRPAFAAEL
ncbi:hypothetical protein GCM10011583_63840 [Streptomyces camponoticapitis]|uniref:Secreted protein n=1 Tax=Streptomyces camponoticapitis TaxID=1616125 RepID=A0ABQ2ES43_9ACTN|nr:hypothetical protein GCM10011583_63840 [Streptomyces camponoticapitis]